MLKYQTHQRSLALENHKHLVAKPEKQVVTGHKLKSTQLFARCNQLKNTLDVFALQI